MRARDAMLYVDLAFWRSYRKGGLGVGSLTGEDDLLAAASVAGRDLFVYAGGGEHHGLAMLEVHAPQSARAGGHRLPYGHGRGMHRGRCAEGGDCRG